LHKALKSAARGDLLELLATDPGSKSDVPSWAKLSGNELVGWDEREGVYRYVIRKA
jgi:tRNA 2-thiouridine synthesizing protein A